MTRPLSHDEAFELLDSLAFDALDEIERSAVAAHVAECESCRVELAQLRETVSAIAFVAHTAREGEDQNRDRIRSRLLARAAADADADEGR